MPKILVVDDSPINRRSVRRILEAQGAVVEDVPSGEEAVKVLKGRKDIDMVILDYNMGAANMNGAQTASAIKQLPEFKGSIVKFSDDTNVKNYMDPLDQTKQLNDTSLAKPPKKEDIISLVKDWEKQNSVESEVSPRRAKP